MHIKEENDLFLIHPEKKKKSLLLYVYSKCGKTLSIFSCLVMWKLDSKQQSDNTLTTRRMLRYVKLNFAHTFNV